MKTKKKTTTTTTKAMWLQCITNSFMKRQIDEEFIEINLTSVLSWIAYAGQTTGESVAQCSKWIGTATKRTSAEVIAQRIISKSIWIIVLAQKLTADQHQRHAYGKQYSCLWKIQKIKMITLKAVWKQKNWSTLLVTNYAIMDWLRNSQFRVVGYILLLAWS